MDIEFVCEHCGKMLKVQEYLAGQTTDCYNCGQPVMVPQEATKAVIEFGCPGCGARFRVPSARSGSRTKCPKCQALLTVPGAAAQAAPRSAAPAAETSSTYAVQQTPAPIRSRMAQTMAAPQADGKPAVFTPKRNTTSMGMMFFWIAVGAMLLIALILLAVRGGGPGGPPGGSYEKLDVDVKYRATENVFQIVNNSSDTWQSVKLTIDAGGSSFIAIRPEIGAKQNVLVNGGEFSGPGGATYSYGIGSEPRLTIVATLPSGRMGQFKSVIRAPKPSSAPPKAVEKPAAKPADEGKVVD
jgi:predicted RNA-binding Zn-ribbon protein involved in translation (DUF1610 family)